MAREDGRIVAITPAMPVGSKLEGFAKEFPDRMFDVGIAEQHAATMAAAMAMQGMKPFLAIYSTFLQRAYDQVVHDICRQNANVFIELTVQDSLAQMERHIKACSILRLCVTFQTWS